MTRLTEDETFVLTHASTWGSDGYPIRKAKGRWWVDGIKGCGSCPKPFLTKAQAIAQWEAYTDTLCDKKAGRL